MNPQAIMKVIDHRTSPLPKGLWVMTQIWHELLFAHWPIAPELLRSLIPPVLTLDTYELQAWVGIVPFRMSYVRPRGIPHFHRARHLANPTQGLEGSADRDA